MKRFFSILMLGLSIAVFSLSGCTDDSSDPKGPILSFVSGTNLISDDASVVVGTPVRIKLNGQKRDDQMSDLTVFVNGVKASTGAFKVNGNTVGANPFLLFGTEKDAFTFEFELGTSFSVGTVTYEFQVKDAKGEVSVENIAVSFTGSVITRKDSLTVWNFSGPNFGGVDLKTLAVVGGNDAAADIRDAGIVDPLTDQTWIKRFVPLNNNVIRKPAASFDFDLAAVSEQIKDAFDNGSLFDPNSTATKELVAGDVFLVKFNTNQYAAVKVNFLIETSVDNLDYYLLTVKK
ncbi:MAG TPA: hypothetical protein VFX48_02180 [Saprospiraceae bacterium]|nr:hypothetical protein [Saprospiraceae bacterium]